MPKKNYICSPQENCICPPSTSNPSSVPGGTLAIVTKGSGSKLFS